MSDDIPDPRVVGGPRWIETKPHEWRNQHLGDVEAWMADNWLSLIVDFRHRAELNLFDPADTLEFVGAWGRVEHQIELERVRGLKQSAPATPNDAESSSKGS